MSSYKFNGNIDSGKIRENVMIKQNLKLVHPKKGHYRHHSDLNGIYNQVLSNLNNLDKLDKFITEEKCLSKIENKGRNKKEKQLSKKRKIMREIFSPPTKRQRRKKQISYDSESNYGHDFPEERSFEGRNFTPGIGGVDNSFGHNEINNSFQRNFTSDGATGRKYLNTAETDTIHSLPGIGRQDGYKTSSDPLRIVPQRKFKLMYITPNEYNKRTIELMNGNKSSCI